MPDPTNNPEPPGQHTISWPDELARFAILAVLGAATSYLSVNIPYTDVFIEGRWIFGFIGFAILNHWGMALLLAGVLSVSRLSPLPLSTVFIGNMMYALPILLIIRLVHTRWLARLQNWIGYGLAWLLMILFCYQIATTPAIWGFIAFLRGRPIWPGIIDGWREQPFLIESLLVGVISALSMLVLKGNNALRASRQELAITLYSIGDGVIATDTGGRVRRMNPVAEQLTGWREAEAAGKPLDEVFRIINEETHRAVESPVSRVLRQGVIVGLANHTLLISHDGQTIPIADAGAPILTPQGQITGVVLVFRDQTEERLNQRLIEARLALIEYAALHPLDALISHALALAGALADSPTSFYHPSAAIAERLPRPQWFIGDEPRPGIAADCLREKKPLLDNTAPSSDQQPAGPGRSLLVPVIREDRVVAVLGVAGKPADYTAQDIRTISYLADVLWEIAQQKQAAEALRESQERLDLALRSANLGLWDWDIQSGQNILNERWAEMLGYTLDELGQCVEAWQDLLHPDDFARVMATVNAHLEGKTDTYEAEYRLRTRDNRWRWILDNGKLIERDAQGRPRRMVGTHLDITERKQAQMQIQADLAEKEALLREIHHRVKNNLQVISSLLDLQAQYAQDTQAAVVLRESQSRVRAMAIVHELLYQPSDLSHIDMNVYVQTLISDLLATYQSDKHSPIRLKLESADLIHIQVDVQNIFFEVQKAIPCGLIINELVSNAFKHAFPADAVDLAHPHQIRVAIEDMPENRYRLTVSNNGVGLSPDFRFPNHNTLGLFLVDTFVRQLKGQIEWHNKDGVCCEIIF